jgi:hypothetical protein
MVGCVVVVVVTVVSTVLETGWSPVAIASETPSISFKKRNDARPITTTSKDKARSLRRKSRLRRERDFEVFFIDLMPFQRMLRGQKSAL